MLYASGHMPPGVTTSPKVIAGDASHASVAVAVPVCAGSVAAVHSTVVLPGQVIAGAVTSRTTTVVVQVPAAPPFRLKTSMNCVLQLAPAVTSTHCTFAGGTMVPSPMIDHS
jgi:hypothetical protein